MTGWDTARIGAVCTTFSGGTPSTARPEYYRGDIPWIASAELNQGRISSVRGCISKLGLDRSSAKLVRPGTPLIALYGATAGVPAIAEIGGAINQAVLAMVPTGIDSEFLYQWLRANRDQIIDRYTQGGQPNLSGAIVRSIEVPLPPAAEQRRIASALRDADNLIVALESRIAKKRAIKQGLIQQLLTGRTRLPRFDGAWAPVRLRDAGSTYGGLVGKSKEDFGTGSADFVTFMEVMGGVRLHGTRLERVKVGPAERQNRILRGDVLFNGSSETPEEVALAALVDFDPSPQTYLNSFCFGYRLKDRSQIDPTYLAHFFRSGQGREVVSVLAQGATRYNIAKTKLMQVSPTLPPIDEQRAIVEVLGDSEVEIDALNLRLAKARAIKTGMMQQLLTGRVRLPVGVAS